jgi:filamentous hemagglutinin family protein
MWMAVSEKVAAGWFGRPLTVGVLILSALLATGGTVNALDPNALPTGGQVVAGTASIAQTGSAMTVNQQTDRMIAHWNSFNIGQNASVAFRQPGAASVALNRILDQNPSQIFGSLSANGQVFLVNPAGVYFGSTARVDVGGLVASSLNLKNENFLAGKYHFENGGSAGAITNNGSIRTANGGYVAFLSPKIANEGSIDAPGGTVALAAADKVSLDFTGDSLVTFTVDRGAVDALVENRGIIKAENGMVMMTATAANSLTQAVINSRGIIEARGLSDRGGRIWLDAGDNGQTIVSGTLDVSSASGKGGDVSLLGGQVGLFGSGMIEASGATGGGNVMLGGDYKGENPAVRNASATVLGKSARINADAWTRGNGGRVILWSDDYTGFYGAISAKGGQKGGDGGFVETSSRRNLQALGSVFLGAPAGQPGSWLLDPYDVTITDDPTATTVGIEETENGFVAVADDAVISIASLKGALDAGGNVTISTGEAGEQTGTITVAGNLEKTGSNDAQLTLAAAGDIVMTENSSITSGDGKLDTTLTAGGAGKTGDITLQKGSTIATNGGNVSLSGSSEGAVTLEGATVTTDANNEKKEKKTAETTTGTAATVSDPPQTTGGTTTAAVSPTSADTATATAAEPPVATTATTASQTSTTGSDVPAIPSTTGTIPAPPPTVVPESVLRAAGAVSIASGSIKMDSAAAISASGASAGAIVIGNSATKTVDIAGSISATSLLPPPVVTAPAPVVTAVTAAPITAPPPATNAIPPTATAEAVTTVQLAIATAPAVATTPEVTTNAAATTPTAIAATGSLSQATTTAVEPITATVTASSTAAFESATSAFSAGQGGSIAIVGQSITLASTSKLDVSGASGGSISVGGTETLQVNAAGTIDASAKPVGATATTATSPSAQSAGTEVTGQGGSIAMTAGNASTGSGVIVHSGTLKADGVAQGGRIELNAGQTTVSGTLDASATDGKGGSVIVTGEKVGLFGVASVDASGAAGGGTIHIGGGFQGKDGTIRNAAQTAVGRDASIRADGGASGNGGTVVLWSDDYTGFGGRISARGGTAAGDGGLVEVSSHGELNFQGTVDTRAANGTAGELLLDPTNIVVATADPGGGAVSRTAAADLDQFADNPAETSWITPANLVGLLNTAAVTMQAYNDITVADAVDASANAGNYGLTLTAGRSIVINDDITLRGSFTATANATEGAGVNRAAGAADFTMAAGKKIDTSINNDSISITIDSQDTMGVATLSNLASGSGYITLTADSMALIGAAEAIAGTGQLTLRPLTLARPILLGANGGAGDLALNTTELATLKETFSFITIGDSSDTGGITFSNAFPLHASAIHFRNSGVGGSITFDGTASMNITADQRNYFYTETFTQDPGATLTSVSNIEIYADSIVLNGAANSLTANLLSLTPYTTTRPMYFGADGGAGVSSIDTTEMATMQNSAYVYIGGTPGGNYKGGVTITGAIPLHNSALLFYNDGVGGSITLDGTAAISTNDKTVGFYAGSGNAGAFTQTAGATISTGSGALTINADSIALNGAAGSLTGTGALTLTAKTATRPIVVGADGAATDFALNNSELASLGNTFSGITIGSASLTGGLTLTGAFPLSGCPLTFYNKAVGGSITLDGTAAISTSNKAVTFYAGAFTQAAGATVSTGSGSQSITADSIALNGAANSFVGTGTLTLAPITATRPVIIGADGAATDFSLNTSELLTLKDGFSSISIGSTSLTGGLTIANPFTIADSLYPKQAAGGSFTVNATPTVTGALGFSGAAPVALNASVNATAGVSFAGPVTVGADDLTVNAGTGTATFSSTVAHGANHFTVTADNVALSGNWTGTGSRTLQPTTIAQTISLAGGAGTFALSAAELGYLKNDTPASVTIGRAGGTGAIAGGAFSFDDSLALRGGAITQTGDWTLSNTLALQSGAGNNITLDRAGNDFGGAVSVVSGNNVSLRDTNALALAASTVSGNLTLQTGGAITQSGDLAVTGTTSITAGANDATLDRAGNNFGGAVSVISGNNVSLRDTNALALGASTVSGNLTLQTGGALTQSGDLAVTGTTSITAGANDATLNRAGNNFTGAVSMASAKNIALNDSNAMSLGAINATGTVDIATLTNDLTLTGSIVTTDATANAIKLNAGKSAAAGTAAGGHLIVSGGTVTTGAGGRATLYTGGVSGSTGLTALVGSGSGRFRYNSDETATNYTTALGAGSYAVYREQPTVTTTASDASKTYDGLAYSGGNGVATAGFVNGDTAASLGGALTYSGTSQGAVNAGTYAITPGGYTNGLGYALAYSDGSLTVNKVALTVTANDASKTYDGAAYSGGNGVAYVGFVGGETSAVLSGALTYGGNSQGAINAGTYGIAPSGLTAANYSLSYVNGTLTITPAALNLLSISANDASKTYGTLYTFNGTGFSPVGLQGGDTIGSVTLTSDGAPATAPAGSYAIIPSNATGGTFNPANYRITYVNGVLTVTPAPLSITANDASRNYNGIAYSGGNGVTYAGFVNGETRAVLGGSLTYGGTSQGVVNAGSYGIIPGGLTAANYSLSYVNGTLTITPVPLSITANDASRNYNGIAYSGGNGVTTTGFVNGETSAVLGGSLTYGGTSQGAVNAGSYSIIPGGLTASNYTIGYTDGTLEITGSSQGENVDAGMTSPQNGINGTGNNQRAGTGMPSMPTLGPGAGSTTLAGLATTSLVTAPPAGTGNVVLTCNLFSIPVTVSASELSMTLVLGNGGSRGPDVEVCALPVFAQRGTTPASLQGHYVLSENGQDLSLTRTAPPATWGNPALDGASTASAPFTLNLENGMIFQLGVSVTADGVLIVTAPDSAGTLDVRKVVLMAAQVAREVLQIDPKTLTSAVFRSI